MNKGARLVKQGGTSLVGTCWDLEALGVGKRQGSNIQAKPKAKQATTTTLQHDVVDQAEV